MIDRYIARSMLGHLAVITALITAVVVFGQLLRLAGQVARYGITAGMLAKAVVYSLPPVLGVIIPLACLLAGLLAFSRLAEDSELTALQLGGMSAPRLLWPVLLVGLGASALSLVIMVWAGPWGVAQMRDMLGSTTLQHVAHNIQPGRIYSWSTQKVLLVQGRDEEGVAQGLVLIELDPLGGGRLTQARAATVLADEQSATMALADGMMLTWDKERLTRVALGNQRVPLLLPQRDVGKAGLFMARQGLPMASLLEAATDPQRRPRDRYRLRNEFHKRLALPCSAVLLALLGAILGASSRRLSLGASLISAALMVGGYYYLLRSLEMAAEVGSLPSGPAVWGATLALGLVVLALLLRAKRRGLGGP